MNNHYNKYETNGDRNKNLSLEKYLNKIKSYLKDMIINFQESDTWKVQLTITINFMSTKNVGKQLVIHSKNKNVKFILTMMQTKLLMNSLSHFVEDIKAI